MIPFTGFSPSVDEHTQGVVSDCDMLLPTVRGFKGAPSYVSSGYGALATTCQGAAFTVKLDNSTRLFAGTATKLYEGIGGVWTDVSRVAVYTSGIDSKWRFAQFGDVTLAANGTDTLQKSVGSGAFSDLAGAPKATCIETVAGFVMLANYNDGTSTPDGWYCSGIYDYTNWTASAATQSAYGRLFDTPGQITALKRLGNSVVAYKKDSMYLGQYIGPPIIWSWQLISSDIGSLSHESVVNIGTAHLFVGKDNIWMYDGSRPIPIAEELREWFFQDMTASYNYKIQATHDHRNSLVYFYYPSSTTTLDRCIVYNYKTRKWGKANRSIESTLEYISAGLTYDQLNTLAGTYTGIPSVSYGSPFWTASTPNMAVFDTNHTLQLLTGSSVSSYITTGAIGDDANMTLLKRVQPRLTQKPVGANMTNYYRMTDGDNYVTDNNINIDQGRFDMLREARWHKVKMTFTGDVEISGASYLIVPTGSE